MMKKTVLLITVIVLAASAPLHAQLLKDARKLLGSKSAPYTEGEAAEGIREALIKGTSESVNLISLADGYFGNPEIKIPFPQDARNVESTLRSMGLGKKVDDAVQSLNRAAEDAAMEAKPIFIEAIKSMSIKDAMAIVKGEQNAATQYLQKTTTASLSLKFKPVIKKSLDKVDATKYWNDVMGTYNKIPLVQKVNPDLAGYVTDKAIQGLFVMIAKEELKIRKDPLARSSDILKKVFGN